MQDRVGQLSPADGGLSAIAGSPLVTLRGVGVSIGSTAILSGVSFDLASGPPTILIGPNGAGKTTLLKLIMALVAPTAGTVSLARKADGRTIERAFVFQRPVMLRRSAAANVAFALAAAGKPVSSHAIDRLLGQVSLAHLADRPARRLSGGEQQRLALARALAREPDLLLLDEPTASLDPAATKAVEDIVRSIASTGVKIVMSTHDLGQARRLAGDILFLAHGRLVEHAPAAAFFTSPSTEAARRFLDGDIVL